jgi:hypothetical protein
MRCHRHPHRRSWTTRRWTTSCPETRSRCHPPQTPRHEWHSPRRVDAAQDGEARWYLPTEAPRALPRPLPCRRMAARGACVASGSTSMQTRKSRSSRGGEKKGQGREDEAVGSCSCIAGGVVGRRGRKIRIFSKGLDSKAGPIGPIADAIAHACHVAWRDSTRSFFCNPTLRPVQARKRSTRFRECVLGRWVVSPSMAGGDLPRAAEDD